MSIYYDRNNENEKAANNVIENFIKELGFRQFAKLIFHEIFHLQNCYGAFNIPKAIEKETAFALDSFRIIIDEFEKEYKQSKKHINYDQAKEFVKFKKYIMNVYDE